MRGSAVYRGMSFLPSQSTDGDVGVWHLLYQLYVLDPEFPCAFVSLWLKNVLQSELHDSRSTRRAGRCVGSGAARRTRAGSGAEDPAERVRITQEYTGIAWAQAVGHIECFGTQFNPLALSKRKLPGYGLTPIPIMRAYNAALTDISICSLSRRDECCTVQIVRQ